jgi:hypothetical protein
MEISFRGFKIQFLAEPGCKYYLNTSKPSILPNFGYIDYEYFIDLLLLRAPDIQIKSAVHLPKASYIHVYRRCLKSQH